MHGLQQNRIICPLYTMGRFAHGAEFVLGYDAGFQRIRLGVREVG